MSCFPVLLFDPDSTCSSSPYSCAGYWLHKSIWLRGEGLNPSSVPGFEMVSTQRQLSFLFSQSGSRSSPSSGASWFQVVVSLYPNTFLLWNLWPPSSPLHLLLISLTSRTLDQSAMIFHSTLLWFPGIPGSLLSASLFSCPPLSLPIVVQDAGGGGGGGTSNPQRGAGKLLGGISVPGGRFRPVAGLESRALFAGPSEDVRLTSRS